MKYILYNKSDGIIVGHGSSPKKDLANMTSEQIGALEVDEIPNESKKVSKGKVVPKSKVEVDYAERKNAEARMRDARNAALRAEIDTINPLQWENMGEKKRQEWRNYRQQLLDVPQNTPDPHNPVWPRRPGE